MQLVIAKWPLSGSSCFTAQGIILNLPGQIIAGYAHAGLLSQSSRCLQVTWDEVKIDHCSREKAGRWPPNSWTLLSTMLTCGSVTKPCVLKASLTNLFWDILLLTMKQFAVEVIKAVDKKARGSWQVRNHPQRLRKLNECCSQYQPPQS